MSKIKKIIISILTIALGIAFIVKDPGFVVGYAATAIGCYLCISGGYDYAIRLTLRGSIKAVLGVLLVFFPWLMANILLYLFAAFLIVIGIFYLATLFNSRLKGTPMVLLLLIAILYIVVGVLIIINEFAAQEWIIIVMGVSLIIDGLVSLFDALTTKETKTKKR